MKRNTAWVVSIVVGLGAGACGGQGPHQNPLESPLGEIQTAGTPQTVVRIAEAAKDRQWMKDLAIVGDDLYVTVAWSGVYRLPKYGGGITAIDEGTNVEFEELASGDGAVFWEATTFDDNDFPTTHLRRVAVGDVAVSTIYQAPLGIYESSGKNLQVDGSIVYMTQIQNVTNIGGIHRIPTSGGNALSTILPFVWPDGDPIAAFPQPWTAGSGGVFVAPAPCSDAGSCEIQKVTGDGAQTIATVPGGQATVQGSDETSVYVAITPAVPAGGPPRAGLQLVQVDQQTGATVEVTPYAGSIPLLADEREVFFVSAAFTITAVSKQGGALRTVADLTDSHGIWRMAQDDTYLFVLTANSEIVAVPKGTPTQPQP